MVLMGQSIPLDPGMWFLEHFARDSVNGWHRTDHRFSAINGNGFPFQWSMSTGAVPGLRLVLDCGRPGTSIGERVRCTLSKLTDAGTALGLRSSLPALEIALSALIPDLRVLDASLMGLCIGAAFTRTGDVSVKVYVNCGFGDVHSRYARVRHCMSLLGRATAAHRLVQFQDCDHSRSVITYCALDLTSSGIGRIKLYFHPTDRRPEALARAAEAAGLVEAGKRLRPLHDAFLTTESYPEGAVHFSIDFPVEDIAPAVKVDLAMGLFLTRGRDVDEHTLALLKSTGQDDHSYRVLRDLVGHADQDGASGAVPFVGLAVDAEGRRRVTAYFNPQPTPVGTHRRRAALSAAKHASQPELTT